MTDSDAAFRAVTLKPDADYFVPDGSEIRLLPTMKGGCLCHCTLPVGKTTSPVAHRQVEEIWYVASGEVEVWRKNEAADETVRVFTKGRTAVAEGFRPWPGNERSRG